MSLRAKLLLMFAALAVAPLLGVGAFDYLWSSRTLEAHVIAQDSLLATHASDELERRLAVQTSDLAFLAENEETRRLFRARAGETGQAAAAVRADVEPWLASAWRQFAPSYYAIELRDASGGVVLRLGDPPAEDESLARLVTVSRPVGGKDGSTAAGVVVAWPRLDMLLPAEALTARFGTTGYSMVVDREEERVLYHPRGSRARRPWRELDADGLALGAGRLDATRGRFRFHAGDTLRVAAFASLATPPWTVIVTSAVTSSRRRSAAWRLVNLALVLLVVVSVSLAPSGWSVGRRARSRRSPQPRTRSDTVTCPCAATARPRRGRPAGCRLRYDARPGPRDDHGSRAQPADGRRR